MLAECYDLSVQCDSQSHVLPVRASFNGLTRRECWAAARRAGWKVHKDGRALCRHCAAARPRVLLGHNAAITSRSAQE